MRFISIPLYIGAKKLVVDITIIYYLQQTYYIRFSATVSSRVHISKGQAIFFTECMYLFPKNSFPIEKDLYAVLVCIGTTYV